MCAVKRRKARIKGRKIGLRNDEEKRKENDEKNYTWKPNLCIM